ncbi:hypothetical protein H9Q72_004082 [Fusarium xylarioides]|uniref:Uncharacterized protein n=1 Tax=Fusarium xylarioides TaxID=221167 RepID=A0A9P7IML9_9HYPO|nr:hypothetical protein H9Q70_002633 [Fusarium xylarioides]KAG5768389.1 hypothetical protein H9Q72_004082 [Fusarium xylarioides]KAG5783769.1 hypothetical protein H9Q73_002581 [Fusarium xylarioides]KAG5805604.1 hypothetical protein H9Q71_009812 [Fusarium xylarioides]KAG5816361.1 hypothetical protein H9Q74_011166 [Fusarium xylarioides]
MDGVDPRGTLSQSWPYNVNQDSGTSFCTGNSSTEVDIGEAEEDAAQWRSAFCQTMAAGSRLFKARTASPCILRGLYEQYRTDHLPWLRSSQHEAVEQSELLHHPPPLVVTCLTTVLSTIWKIRSWQL